LKKFVFDCNQRLRVANLFYQDVCFAGAFPRSNSIEAVPVGFYSDRVTNKKTGGGC